MIMPIVFAACEAIAYMFGVVLVTKISDLSILLRD